MAAWWGWFALIMLGIGFLFAIAGCLDTLAEIKQAIEKPKEE